jgi:hypothetical protein
MKKQLLTTILLVFSTYIFSQSNATNFKCNDCSGTSHELFKDLDSGKVIVLMWVMPCGACIGGSITSYNIVSSYQSLYPNKVVLYLADDYADTNCQSLESWASSNGIDRTSFSLRFSNPAIKMEDYGSTGMPKTVVLAGTDHKVLLNANYFIDPDELLAAINNALVITGNSDQIQQDLEFTFSQNLTTNSIFISFNLDYSSNTNLTIINSEGVSIQTIFSGSLASGEHKIEFNLENLQSGMYFFQIQIGNKISLKKFIVMR